MKFRLELEEWEVRNLIGIIDVAAQAQVEGLAAMKAKIEAAPEIVEPEAVEAARNGDA